MVTFQNVDLVDDFLDEPFNYVEAAKIFSEIAKEITELHVVVIFVDERLIRQLNKKFRDINKSTDVLSFLPPFPEVDIPVDEDSFGAELYVCPKYIVSQLDDRYGEYDQERLLEEIYRMIIHGILHIGGWEHKTTFDYDSKSEEIEPMFLQQEAILEKYLADLQSLSSD